MKIRSSAAVVLVVGLGVALAGCSQLGEVRAMKAFKDGNKLYAASDWRGAAERYEEALRLNPENAIILFYLANSYDNMYRPTRKGEPANDAYLTKAIEYYQQAAEKIQDPKLKQLSLEYLVAAYGPDKLNDPTLAEPVVLKMIELDPSQPSNYFALAKIYEDSGEYELAQQTLERARQARPNDPTVYMQLAGFYNRQGDFEKTMAALQERIRIQPDNPEAHYTAATFYWDEANRDFRLTDAQKLAYIQSGLEAVDQAIKIREDYMEAYVYKGLLLRLQANVIKDPRQQQALLKEAEALQNKALELRKRQAAGATE
ncbi:MAG: tetratricopeptide repeat protein [Acidobacteriota bacterium]